MKKICFVTAARSEYGLLKWLMKDINKSDDFELQIIATGGHLLWEQGHTIDQIIEDGFEISYIIDVALDTTLPARIAETMGRMAGGFAKAFEELKPDFLVVLGDRYELLPICNTAFVMRIPIIHISGGDVTEGAIDNGVRNAVTMLADYHFPGTADSARNIVRMRGSEKNVWTVGEPGLDAFIREKLMTREDLAFSIGLDIDKKWVLMTYHAETKGDIQYDLTNVAACIDVLVEDSELQTVITYANADFGGKLINDFVEQKAKLYPDKIKIVPSLGHMRYLSYMKQVRFMIGNSSSGIVEAPFMGVPVVNIGDRQKGRYQCKNIVQCDSTVKAIRSVVKKVINITTTDSSDMTYWGDGHTSERIINILKNEIVGD